MAYVGFGSEVSKLTREDFTIIKDKATCATVLVIPRIVTQVCCEACGDVLADTILDHIKFLEHQSRYM